MTTGFEYQATWKDGQWIGMTSGEKVERTKMRQRFVRTLSELGLYGTSVWDTYIPSSVCDVYIDIANRCGDG